MQGTEIIELLKDLRSIKLSAETRAFVDKARDRLQSSGSIPFSWSSELRKIGARYRAQLTELRASRERARRTNGLRKLGITLEDAKRLVEERKSKEAAMKADIGI